MKTSRVVAYIDGFNLYNGLRAKYHRRYLWLDLEALCGSLLLPNQDLVGVRYFTAPIRRRPASQQRQQTYWNALEVHTSCVRIHRGRFQERTLRCRACRATWRSYEEKETDVAIGVALVDDAAIGAFDSAFLLSADSDLSPAVHAVRRVRPQAKIVAVFPPARSSDTLRKLADTSFTIAERKLRRSLLPAQVGSSEGKIFTQPPTWK